MSNKPIPSDSVEDLKLNVLAEDIVVNKRDSEQTTGRLGDEIITFFGMEKKHDRMMAMQQQQFEDFLFSSGFEDLGQYRQGLQITSRNQGFTRCDPDGSGCNFYTPSDTLSLPYQTTGSWADEGGFFVVRGDGPLRQDLAQPSIGPGIIGYSPNAYYRPGTVGRELQEIPAKVKYDADRAEAAAESALLLAGLYPDTNTIVNGGNGFPAVQEGHFASVPSQSQDGFLDLYKVVSGQAVYIDTYPNSEAVKGAVKSLPIALTAGRGSWEFYNDDHFFPGYFVVDMNGYVLKDLLEEIPELFGFEFHGNDDDALTQVIIGVNGEILIGWDQDGNASVSGLVVPDGEVASQPELLPYLDGTSLRAVGAEDYLCADVSGLEVSGVFPASGNRVRAIVNKPGISQKITVSAYPDGGVIIPDNEKTLHVIIGVGQSLMIGANSENSMISTQSIYPDHVLMFTSSFYSDIRMGNTTPSGQPSQPLDPDSLVGFEPLVARRAASGPRGETVIETMANTLASEAQSIGAQFRSLSYTAGVGGTSYAGLKKGSQIYENMLIALRKAKVLAELNGWKIVVDAAVCKHGEADSGSTVYKDNLLEWRSDISADVKQITGQVSDVHFILSQPSTFTTATPRAALVMLDLHNENPLFHLACPDYAIGAADYYTDLLHMLGPGYAHVGSYMARSWRGSLWAASGKAKVLQMLSATRTGRTVNVSFDVPVAPLQIDTTTVQEQENYGFRFFDSSGQIAISSVTLNPDGQSVSIQLAADPSGDGERLDYALKPQTNPRTVQNMPRGNICDSSTEKSIHNNRPMKNWAVHQLIELNG